MTQEYGGEYCRRGHVPAFGGWDWNDAVPFTQCFETATTQQPSYLHHYPPYPQDRDLYLAGDLYDNHHLVAPAVILLPRRRVLTFKFNTPPGRIDLYVPGILFILRLRWARSRKEPPPRSITTSRRMRVCLTRRGAVQHRWWSRGRRGLNPWMKTCTRCLLDFSPSNPQRYVAFF